MELGESIVYSQSGGEHLERSLCFHLIPAALCQLWFLCQCEFSLTSVAMGRPGFQAQSWWWLPSWGLIEPHWQLHYPPGGGYKEWMSPESLAISNINILPLPQVLAVHVTFSFLFAITHRKARCNAQISRKLNVPLDSNFFLAPSVLCESAPFCFYFWILTLLIALWTYFSHLLLHFPFFLLLTIGLVF